MTIFLVSLLAIISIIIVGVIYSTIKINIKDLILINAKIYKFNLEISINLFSKVKCFKLSINDKTLEKLKDSSKRVMIDKILNTKILRDYKNIKKTIFLKRKKILKIVQKSEIENFRMYAKVGTENACITAYLITFISSILAIILARKISNPQYKIEPIYMDKTYIYLSINCIFKIKLVHIINIIKSLK